MIYKNSKLSIYYEDARESFSNVDCIVELNAKNCVVKYDDESGIFIEWKGLANGAGHFELAVANFPQCKASLHCFTQSIFLEGYVKDVRESYMWRIKLIA